MTTSALNARANGRRYIELVLFLATLTLFPIEVMAQPAEGQFTAGGDFGLFFPADDQFDSAAVWGAFVEGYATRRVGIRGSLFYTSPEFERGGDEHARQLRLGADLIYNWEGGRVHPFVGAGLGAHFMQFTDEGEDVGDSETQLGFDVLGGLEYFLNTDWTVKGELRYHWVDDFRRVDPDGLAMTIGLKRYF
jgi:opacity protein-like surface antigen